MEAQHGELEAVVEMFEQKFADFSKTLRTLQSTVQQLSARVDSLSTQPPYRPPHTDDNQTQPKSWHTTLFKTRCRDLLDHHLRKGGYPVRGVKFSDISQSTLDGICADALKEFGSVPDIEVIRRCKKALRNRTDYDRNVRGHPARYDRKKAAGKNAKKSQNDLHATTASPLPSHTDNEQPHNLQNNDSDRVTGQVSESNLNPLGSNREIGVVITTDTLPQPPERESLNEQQGKMREDEEKIQENERENPENLGIHDSSDGMESDEFGEGGEGGGDGEEEEVRRVVSVVEGEGPGEGEGEREGEGEGEMHMGELGGVPFSMHTGDYSYMAGTMLGAISDNVPTSLPGVVLETSTRKTHTPTPENAQIAQIAHVSDDLVAGSDSVSGSVVVGPVGKKKRVVDKTWESTEFKATVRMVLDQQLKREGYTVRGVTFSSLRQNTIEGIISAVRESYAWAPENEITARVKKCLRNRTDYEKNVKGNTGRYQRKVNASKSAKANLQENLLGGNHGVSTALPESEMGINDGISHPAPIELLHPHGLEREGCSLLSGLEISGAAGSDIMDMDGDHHGIVGLGDALVGGLDDAPIDLGLG